MSKRVVIERLCVLVVGEQRAGVAHPPRYDYLLTDSGRDLEPILLALKEWGDAHCNPGAEPVIFEHVCGDPFHPVTVCAACREAVHPGELTVTGGTGARSQRASLTNSGAVSQLTDEGTSVVP